ncbi:MAG: hypothetical protein JST17_15590 [Bacteroidetes bacterium]|nr:hypothetical protein [Bacteroidota bacterium]MBS1930605.1 hypothetical protein [Bacteroidota bacterium]
MQEETYQTPFSNAMLTSVFVGFVSAILCLIYNIVYRSETGYQPSEIINVSSLIFSVNLFFVIIGLIYSAFVRNSTKPEFVFIIIFLLLIILAVYKSQTVVRSTGAPDHEQQVAHFRGLLTGIVLIAGVGILSIPFLFHNKKFRAAVL